jgi:hypothetical protein
MWPPQRSQAILRYVVSGTVRAVIIAASFAIRQSKPVGAGAVSAVDSEGRTIWITDAHRDDGKRLVARADEKLTAFIELESAIRACGESA